MEASSSLDSWTAVVSESSGTSIDRLSKLIDFGNPPDFYEFVCNQWVRRQGGEAGPWDLLMDGQIILRAVGHPTVLNLKQAVTLTQFALQADTLFDTKLLRRLLAHRLWPEEVPADEVMRTLEVLETLEEPHRLSMTLLKFSKFPDRKVQSKVAKILGRCVESYDVMEDLFQNPDARVRANLLEGLGRREGIEPFLSIIERATKDQNTRVSSIALALRARHGHTGATALIRMRSNSKMNDIRLSAEFAQKIAAGECTSRDPETGEILNTKDLAALASNVNPVGVVDAQSAVAAPVEEVNGEAKAHPDEQP
ncbi:MAG: hypothetical protein JNM66_31755 [Bryobacterales bacterium]|nr:hypothetical protein [Bryobacterales bacterium]